MTRREETAETSDARRFADLLFQIVDQIGLRCFQGWPEAEEQRGEQAEEKCHAEDGDARMEIGDETKVERAEHPAKRLQHEAVAPNADRQSDRATSNRE